VAKTREADAHVTKLVSPWRRQNTTECRSRAYQKAWLRTTFIGRDCLRLVALVRYKRTKAKKSTFQRCVIAKYGPGCDFVVDAARRTGTGWLLAKIIKCYVILHFARNTGPSERVYFHLLDQACTTHGPRKLFLRPAKALSIVENAAKARPLTSNCRSKISSILPRNLYREMK